MNKKIVVLGGGESGVGAAILAKDKGMDVFLSDYGKIAPHYKQQLIDEGIAWEEGGHDESRILAADEVIKSPGIAPTAPIMVKIAERGIPVISEIEFAGRYTDAKMVCITGSNGKTTTTLLTYHILKNAGINVGLAGNVGRSLALQVAREHHDVYVIELSSFQLENMYEFKANIAVMLNITPDHLDRYDYKMQNYVNAKFRIIRNLTPEDAFIFWQDDPVIQAQLRQVTTEARMYPFSEHLEKDVDAYIDADDELVLNTSHTSLKMPRNHLALHGLHNLYNSMAAGLSACLLDIRKEDIRRALEDFEGVEHRLEYVTTVNGVRYINDSKATNVNSCWYALESMPKGVVLILGGKDKGNDYTEIEPLVKEKVKAIVCMGKDNAKLLDFFTGKVDAIYDTHSLQDAVDTCAAIAASGDTVLLSPCCASFDLFSSYEDRGRQFKDAVKRLK
ncbi:UDP-N-acetylmuramoyl-L-alanine--D-glutamate ligase [Muribaculum sp. NM65_B17]|jgi:UDP-N-acetylmuramoylalanine--D-glutamate ligase|uniref:UDP-N-acetylmuramoyl-L-alanine--D-glutamate ligase n=2 Tax=Muribaculum TaxID=1918540 RepID=UPI001093EE5A|nr:UDP-N-acetylmuramoyl-L-alanine--D-glutamate ligase [Muribaculum sp. NM65_B17]TGY04213.1 UDP-N-acetylmuramoyl-L-alanine--D-glutamate ligase [Muribaculum sp. NM65_B17]THG43127.1 UDP-N-acetylmuramoyl-L-alanine--D-glutamate ligase [Muribaculaceae bacterium]